MVVAPFYASACGAGEEIHEISRAPHAKFGGEAVGVVGAEAAFSYVDGDDHRRDGYAGAHRRRTCERGHESVREDEGKEESYHAESDGVQKKCHDMIIAERRRLNP